jgi:hypothetical protein
VTPFFFGEFLPLGNKRNIPVRLIQMIFLKRMHPKSPDFQRILSEIAIYRQLVPTGRQNIAGFSKISNFPLCLVAKFS